MKKILVNSIIFFLLIFSSCLKDNIPLSNREDYIGDQLRIDGLYHQISSDGYIRNVQFFYRNGIKLDIQVNDDIKDPSDLYSILTQEKIEYHRKRKYFWGIFKINDNDFLSEQWDTPIDGNYVLIMTMTGEILSDTCFMITKYVHSQAGVFESLNAKWYFYPYSPKPDSTNIFIK